MAAVLERTETFLRRQGDLAADDPLGYLISVSRKIGVGMLVTGVGMGAAGWYLKAASTTAANNEVNTLGNIGTIFSNIKAPTFQPAATGTAPVLGPNPISDVTNFAQDAYQDITAAGTDIAQIGAAMGTLAEDVAEGLIDIAKSFLAFVMHFPDILWNGLVWAIGGALADIMNWLFPYFIVFGIILIVLSLVVSLIRWAWQHTVSEPFRAAFTKWRLRFEARVEARWDRLFGNYQQPETVAVAPEPEIPVSTTPPDIEAGGPAEAEGTKPEERGGAPAPGDAATPPEPAVQSNAASEQAPDRPEAQQPPSQVGKETNGTTAQTEQLLGGVPPPGWSEDDVQDYLEQAPPKAWTGKEIAVRADELLA